MRWRYAVAGLALVLASGAWAQEAEEAAEQVQPAVETAPTPPSRLLQPMNVDLRLSGDTNLFLLYVDAGLGVDVGLLPMGPGTLAVGGELNAGTCLVFCLVLNGLTGFSWWDRYLNPMGRVSFHFQPPAKQARQLEKVDLYAVVMAGPVLIERGAESADRSVSFVGTDTSLAVGLGVGANYFLSGPLFVGGELRARYAAGRYAWTVRAGQYQLSDSESTWSLSGVNLRFFAGLRL
jgi:hypothetical protein